MVCCDGCTAAVVASKVRAGVARRQCCAATVVMASFCCLQLSIVVVAGKMMFCNGHKTLLSVASSYAYFLQGEHAVLRQTAVLLLLLLLLPSK